VYQITRATVVGVLKETITLSSIAIYRASPPSCTKSLEIGLCSKPHYEFCVPSHPQGYESASKPLAFDSAPLTVLMRSCPPFPLYSVEGIRVCLTASCTIGKAWQ